jgi:hypothetical protein
MSDLFHANYVRCPAFAAACKLHPNVNSAARSIRSKSQILATPLGLERRLSISPLDVVGYGPIHRCDETLAINSSTCFTPLGHVGPSRPDTHNPIRRLSRCTRPIPLHSASVPMRRLLAESARGRCALNPRCGFPRRSSNANSLCGQNSGSIPGISATFQRDNLRRHF